MEINVTYYKWSKRLKEKKERLEYSKDKDYQ
jgi:hypothetical protein